MSLASPGSGDELEKEQQGNKKKPRAYPAADPRKDPDEWNAPDTIAYFRIRWKEAFPGEMLAERKMHTYKQVAARIAWLQIQKHPISTMKKVIDYLFDNWGEGLPDRIKWEDSRPTESILATMWFFEKVFKEVTYGKSGKPRLDAYDEEAAKEAREINTATWAMPEKNSPPTTDGGEKDHADQIN